MNIMKQTMDNDDMIYEVEVLCDYDQWWRYNIFMTIVGRSASGDKLSYQSLIDRIYEIGDGSEVREPPAGYTNQRGLKIEVEKCNHAELYLYVIANTFPRSLVIRDSPSFNMELVVRRDGVEIERSVHDVNQWGGTTLIGYIVGRE